MITTRIPITIDKDTAIPTTSLLPPAKYKHTLSQHLAIGAWG